MQRLILTIIAAFVMAIVFGPVVIPWLKRMKFGQTIYDLGPQSHKKKQGIPTMGGVIFAVPALIAALAFAQGESRWDFLLIAILCAVGFGLVGFVDDFIKVKLHRSLGLTPKQKLVPQVIIALGLSFWAYNHPLIGSSLTVPFFGVEWELGWAYIPVMVFILVGTVNSANLLDGLDGLLDELYTVADCGCGVLDVTVEHPVYGQLSGQLQVFSRYDADVFWDALQKNGAQPLCSLTGDIHLHTLVCPDEARKARVLAALEEKGYLMGLEK